MQDNNLDDIVKKRIKKLGLDTLFKKIIEEGKDKPLSSKRLVTTIKDDIKFLENSVKGFLNKNKKRTFKVLYATLLEKIKLLSLSDSRVIIDIGSYALKILRIGYQGKKTILEDALYIPLKDREDKDDFLYKTILTFLKHTSFKNHQIYLTLPRALLIVKFVELPTLDLKEAAKMLKFEAENNLVLPLSEMEIDYSIIGQTYQLTQAIIVAIKKEHLRYYLELIRKLHIKVESINVSALALYNFSKSFDFSQNKTILQLHIGANYTDINIIENGKLKVCRGIEIGADSINQKLIKNLSMDEASAEKKKREVGISIMEEHLNEENKKISQICRVWADRILYEITQTIHTYRLNTTKEEIDLIALSGGAAKLPNLNEYIRSKLKVTVVKEYPLRIIHIDNPSSAKVYKGYHYEINPLLGLAPKKFTLPYINVNLLPAQIKNYRKLKEKNKKKITIAITTITLGITLLITPKLILNIQMAKLNRLTKEFNELKPEVTNIQSLKDKIKTIKDYIFPRHSSMEILREISLLTPEAITIDNFSFEKNRQVVLIGKANSHASTLAYVQALGNSSFFADVKLQYTKKINSLKGKEVYFKIQCQLK